jgi:hypothetical protein
MWAPESWVINCLLCSAPGGTGWDKHTYTSRAERGMQVRSGVFNLWAGPLYEKVYSKGGPAELFHELIDSLSY